MNHESTSPEHEIAQLIGAGICGKVTRRLLFFWTESITGSAHEVLSCHDRSRISIISCQGVVFRYIEHTNVGFDEEGKRYASLLQADIT